MGQWFSTRIILISTSCSARMLNWKLSLLMLLAIILLFIPVSLSLVLTMYPSSGTKCSCKHIFNILFLNADSSRKRSVLTQAVLSLAPVILYLFLLSCIPLPDALVSSDVITAAVSRLVVLGTIILGLLSGFGAVSNAWAFFPLFSRNKYKSRPSWLPCTINCFLFQGFDYRGWYCDSRTVAIKGTGGLTWSSSNITTTCGFKGPWLLIIAFIKRHNWLRLYS